MKHCLRFAPVGASIRENHSNMIPAVGINIHEVGTPKIDDVQMDVLYGNSIDLDDLRYVPQIWNDQEGLSKIGQIIDAFPDAKVVGELPGLTVQERSEPDMDAVKPVYVDEAAKLAAEIDRFPVTLIRMSTKIRLITGNYRCRT